MAIMNEEERSAVWGTGTVCGQPTAQNNKAVAEYELLLLASY